MKVGIVGIGKMGGGLVARLLKDNHQVNAFDLSCDAKKPFDENELFAFSPTLKGLLELLSKPTGPTGKEQPKILWLMVPAGDPVDRCIEEIQGSLSAGDIIVDGGNSNYRDTVRRYESLQQLGISYIDVGTSGGVWGESQGFCMMVGGDKESFDLLTPVFASLCGEEAFSYMGKSGAGHYVKMVHNAVEYALMQSYGEGMDLLAGGPYDLSLRDVAKVWNRGGVVRSWLLELGEKMLTEDPKLDSIRGYIRDSGTGRWSVEEALRFEVPIPLLATAVFNRYRSRKENSISDRFIAGLRKAFGGHQVTKG